MSRIGQLLDLRRGEGALVAQAMGVLGAVVAGHTLLETARDALFLSRLPASRLPLVYVLIALFAFGTSRFSQRFAQRFGRRTALTFTLFMAAYGAVLLYLLPEHPLMLFVLYVFSGLLGTVAVVQFWMLANHLFTVAQGKRLFGPIAAGGVAGAVLGAGAAAWVVEFAAVERLLLGASAFFMLAAGVLTGLRVDEPVYAQSPSERSSGAWGAALLQVRHHPYLRKLIALVMVSSAALVTTDFMFKSSAAAYFAPDELGAFFARYYAGLNAVALLVQVFVASRVVRRFGVVGGFVVLPLLLLAGGAGTLLFGGALAWILLTKGADGALRHSLHRIAGELLWMPLSEDARSETKELIDGVAVRIAQALTAGVLLLLATLGYASPSVLAAMIIGCTLVWLAVALSLKSPYVALFREALRRGNGKSRLELDLNSIEVVIEALSSRDPERAIGAIRLLVDNDRSRLIPALILYHESDKVLEAALEVVATPERSDWIPLTERLLAHESERARVAAIRALTRNGIEGPVAERLNDISPGVRAHAAFALVQASDAQSPNDHDYIEPLLSMEGPAGSRARAALAQSIAARGDARWKPVLSELLKDSSPTVRIETLRAIAQLPDESGIAALIPMLCSRELRGPARDALLANGDAALAALETSLHDPNMPLGIRRHIPRTISRFGTQRAADILVAELGRQDDGLIRYKVLRGLGRLVVDQPVHVRRKMLEEQMRGNLIEHFRLMALLVPISESKGDGEAFELLRGILEDKARQALERTFRLFQMLHRHEEMRRVMRATLSEDRRVRAQALEFVDALNLNASVPELRELFTLAIDDLEPQERVRRASPFLDRVPRDYRDAIAMAADDGDDSLAILAALHALELGEDTLETRIAHSSEKRNFAPLIEEFRASLKLELGLV